MLQLGILVLREIRHHILVHNAPDLFCSIDIITFALQRIIAPFLIMPRAKVVHIRIISFPLKTTRGAPKPDLRIRLDLIFRKIHTEQVNFSRIFLGINFGKFFAALFITVSFKRAY